MMGLVEQRDIDHRYLKKVESSRTSYELFTIPSLNLLGQGYLCCAYCNAVHLQHWFCFRQTSFCR